MDATPAQADFSDPAAELAQARRAFADDPAAWWSTFADAGLALEFAALAAKPGDELHRAVARAAAACASECLPRWSSLWPRDGRASLAVDAVERWADGRISAHDLARATTGALFASMSARCSEAHAARSATEVIDLEAARQGAASEVVHYVVRSAWDAAWCAALDETTSVAEGNRAAGMSLRRCADLVRQHVAAQLVLRALARSPS